MHTNNCECPHARVIVDHGIPIIEESACGKADCVSKGCQEEAAKKELKEWQCPSCHRELVPAMSIPGTFGPPVGSKYWPCDCGRH